RYHHHVTHQHEHECHHHHQNWIQPQRKRSSSSTEKRSESYDTLLGPQCRKCYMAFESTGKCGPKSSSSSRSWDQSYDLHKQYVGEPKQQYDKNSRNGSKSSRSNSKPSYGSSRGSFWGSSLPETLSEAPSHSPNPQHSDDDDVFQEELVITSSSSCYTHTNLTKLARRITNNRLLKNGNSAYPVPPLNIPSTSTIPPRLLQPLKVQTPLPGAVPTVGPTYWASEDEEQRKLFYGSRSLWGIRFPYRLRQLYFFMDPHWLSRT
ncbi:hypothetical protein FHG87_020806, partial [Trinorchestia longiramus]